MNNAQKVRIYDLSKELNLENKDILEICAQLSITVKSHSSTISESQAERIKAMADKYVANQTSGHGSEPSLKGERKQEILAIHHKQTHRRSSSDSPNSSQDSSPTLVAPPRPPIKPQAPVGVTLSQKPTPVIPAPNQGVTPPEKSQMPIKTEQAPKKVKEPEATLMGAPQRVKPTVKSLDKSSIEKLEVKPTLKSEIPMPKKPGVVSPPSPKPALPQPQIGVKKQVQGKVKPELNRPLSPKSDLDDIPELIAPSVKPLSDLTDDGAIDEETIETPIGEKPKLKRPSPPRPSSKRQKWEEEEEEESKAKASKVAPKAKRRANHLEDDEDDLDANLDSNPIPLSVSLSIARPPKPKSQNKSPVAANKPKKPTLKPDGTTVRAKSDRREQPEVNQRPEYIILDSNLTVRELAERLNIAETEIIKSLFSKGIAVNITQTLDLETARLVTEELGVLIEVPEVIAAATKQTEMLDAKDLEHLQRRPPVVTIMGHVDHGKTTLLDSIRKTKVAQGEAGGITQHIGAYHVDVEHNGVSQQIVFLDTPGHEAFTAMRARGARVTDMAILVVAADDGVQPQTREAFSHAKAAGVPVVVAINKIDKPDANPDRIKQELSELGLVPEEWGGETIMVPVSALKGENLDTLLEMLLLVSEVEELVANPNRLGKGTVIEANLDRARGPVATLLVQNGTLRVGDAIVAGGVFGKIRAMIDDRGQKVEAASPSFAVEILGLNNVPSAGDEFEVYPTEKEARLIAEKTAETQRNSRLQLAMSSRRVTLTTLSAQAQEGELKELNLILKADVQGSVEALLGALTQLPQNEVQIRVLLAAPGEITETDVDLAAASGAVVVGFNTTLASGARASADHEGVDIREYDIIYKLLDDIQGAMEGLLEPEEIESSLGQAQVRAVFPVGRGAVAGCYVQSGKVVRNRLVRIRRGNEVVYQGSLDSLKRMKEDSREVNAGYECGVGIDKFNDWKEGDIIEAYEMTMKRRTLAGK
ncbi:translation initiation factor IF-2 [Aphanothece sacrum]|uniref:Translation initiation factor IF-2 n=1 Tax=Aphanothece sacrum FPU1 TaxID=1920663 RepID=A0A401II81_APHSA|nr:translation initiation factor IF-2 [Aphanothece sacrum]GBF81007.1 translation initiation factor IF-2 [Aphanothece sacrum FPU1]GBF86155.1 translation initiation factor IF-2 [Aphanothece sacrum FPU3]